jgi:hypothetical protein
MFQVLISLDFVVLSAIRTYLGNHLKTLNDVFSLNVRIQKLAGNYAVYSCYFYHCTILSIPNNFKIRELSYSFLTPISLKQPNLLFKLPPWEEASQTTVNAQSAAQMEDKAVKYFIARNI